MKVIRIFLSTNKWILLSALAGIIAGYIYWFHYGWLLGNLSLLVRMVGKLQLWRINKRGGCL